MTVYKPIYSFEVLDRLIDGKKVNMVDRETLECHKVELLTVEEFVEILRDVRENSTRYEFWIEEEKEIEAV